MAADRRRGGNQVIPRPPHWSEDTTTPWSHGASWTIEQVSTVVPRESAPQLPTFPDARRSAVLIVLAAGREGTEVLLTRRSMQMRNHKGEVSFPGGRCDPGETALETALREAHEEVGLDPSLPTVIGEREHISTIVSKSYIMPVVATMAEPVPLTPQTFEADKVMWVPLAELTRSGTYRREWWGQPPMQRPLHFFELDDETVWGATGHMLATLLADVNAAFPD